MFIKKILGFDIFTHGGVLIHVKETMWVIISVFSCTVFVNEDMPDVMVTR